MARLRLLAAVVLGAACAPPEAQPLESAESTGALTLPFSFSMAGALVLANDPLNGTAAQLLADHFSYIGQYAVNGCANNNTPYSCANNGCTYPGNPSAEVPDYASLASFMTSYRNAGLYVGLWGVTYQNVEAEAHCMAEVSNTLKTTWAATPTFFIVDGEKSYETNQGYSQRFVTVFNQTLTFALAKAYTPECHNAVPMAPWLNGGFSSIMPMAYWNDTNTNPSYCLDYLLTLGVPKAKAQVMLDGYKHGTPHTWAEYAADIKSVGAVGFSVWRTVAPAEWDAWKPLIETQKVAVYQSSGDGGTVCSDVCTLGAKQCVDGDRYQVCGNFDADTCSEWSPNHSCATEYPGTTCSNGYCVGCTNDCTAGAHRCSDASHTEVCGNFDADACSEWGPATACSAGESCGGGLSLCAAVVADAGQPDGGPTLDAGPITFDAGRGNPGDAGGPLDAAPSTDAGLGDSTMTASSVCGCQSSGVGAAGLLALAVALAHRRRIGMS